VVERSPDPLAIVDGERRLSYAAWYCEIGRVAGGLAALAGAATRQSLTNITQPGAEPGVWCEVGGFPQLSSGITCIYMPDEHSLTLRQVDQARSDFALIEGHLEFIADQLAQMPTRGVRPRFGQGSELRLGVHDALDDPEQVEGAAREAVDASHCHHVAAGEAVEHAEKLAPVGWDTELIRPADLAFPEDDEKRPELSAGRLD